MGEREPGAVADVFAYLAERRRQNKVEMYLKTGRLPPEAPKTFANFDFDRLRGADRAAIEQLPAMANLYARRSLASVGPEGVGNYAEKRIMSGNGLPPQVIRSRQPRPFA